MIQTLAGIVLLAILVLAVLYIIAVRDRHKPKVKDKSKAKNLIKPQDVYGNLLEHNPNLANRYMKNLVKTIAEGGTYVK